MKLFLHHNQKNNWIIKGSIFLVIFIDLLPFIFADQSVDFRKALMETTRTGGGIACITRTDILDDAIKAAENPSWIIHLLVTDSDKRKTLIKEASAMDVLGRNIYIDIWDGKQLPHADHLLDLLFIDQDFPEAEALRAISPVRGKAFFAGRVLTKPELPGSDWWTNRLRGADNNPASQDTAFQLPVAMQYTAMPFYSSLHGSQLVSGGIRIEFYDWVVRYSGGAGTAPIAGKLLARSVYNGQIIWMRDMPERIKPDSQICAVAENKIFLADSKPGQVMVYDISSGEELAWKKSFPEDQRHVTWLSAEGDRLYLLLADPDWPRVPVSVNPHAMAWDLERKERVPGEGDSRGLLPAPPEKLIPSSIICQDTETGKVLWRHDEPAPVDFRHIGVREGRVYFFSEKNRLACVDDKGSIVWENRDQKWIDQMVPPTKRLANANLRNSSSMIIGPKTLLFGWVCGTKTRKELGVAIDISNGRLLWERLGFDAVYGAFTGDGIYWHGATSLDQLTGKQIDISQPTQHVFGHCGYQSWIPAVGKVGHLSFGFKNPCAIPPITAGGVLTYFPSVCNCSGVERGAAGYMAGGAILDRAENQPEHPLITGGDIGKGVTLNKKPLTGDWNQYRGDARHRGGSPNPAPKQPVLKAVVKLAVPLSVPTGHYKYGWEWLDRPTPPVTDRGRAFYATSTGLIRAVKIEDGQELWTTWTGGAVMTAPVILNGRLYAGSGDGWVYCLDASNGKLVWRWRGAPTQRRMMVYDKLMSSWPVISVVADGDTVYGSAGRFEANGSVLFALDAVTGNVHWTKWHRNDSTLMKSYTGNTREGLTGYITLLKSELPMDDFVSIIGVYDSKTGQGSGVGPGQFLVRPESDGQDCIGLDDHTVLRGGFSLFEDPSVRNFKYNGNYNLYTTGGNTKPKRMDVKSSVHISRSVISPSLKGEDIVMVGGAGRNGEHTVGLSLWKTADWLDKQPGKPLNLDKARWERAELHVNALVLCRNAVITAIGQSKASKARGTPDQLIDWKLCALSRTDGKELWSVNLPCEPSFNGIAPSAEGDWVVTLRDGSLAIVGDNTEK